MTDPMLNRHSSEVENSDSSSPESLITNHIDIWTTAIERKSSAGRGTSNKFSLYGIKKLRELILELAVRGKLVPQDANDEPASILLKRIAAEKTKLVKDKKIKKPKALSEVGEDEKPFELPQGWKWSRFQDISSYIQRGKGPSYAEVGKVKVISQKCVQNTGFDMSPARYVTDESLEKYQPERFLINDDILWNSTGTGTVGRANVISNVDVNSLVADSHVTVIRPLNIYSRFLWCFIMAPGIQSRIAPDNENALVSGSTNQVELNTSSVMSVVAPVAPLEEQHRIVAKVDELMSLCDALEAQTEASISAHQTLVETLLNALLQPNIIQQKDSQSASPESSFADSLEPALNDSFVDRWDRVAQHFDTLFTTAASIDTLKQTILQLAVMGKLVEQDPNDEPAAKLLERIDAEKAQLIKDGKIKKQKPLPAISDEEKSFELPEGWEWVNLAELVTIRGGKRLPKGQILSREVTPYIYIRVSDMRSGSIREDDLHYISEDVQSQISNYIITSDDIYMTIVGATIGKCGLIPIRFNGMNLTENAARLTPFIGIDKHYLFKYLDSAFAQAQFFDKTKQVGVQKMALNRLSSTKVPFPSLEEQHRIVAKVDELMALCDQLKARLSDAQTTQLHLTDAIVEQAI
jgi:type I restriction enzyme S subunit